MINENLNYTLHCEGGQKLYYNPHTSSLTNENGKNVYEKNPIGITKINDYYVETPVDYNHSHLANPIHPFFNPARKVNTPMRLKIQLGLKCNYKCEYCSQASFVADASISNEDDVNDFIEKFDKRLDLSGCGIIELWGGEPLLYWKQIKKLVPFLKSRCPDDVEFLIVTNGSLLTREKVDFFKEYKFTIAMSHDGPGYHLRGPDPLDSPRKYALVKELIELNKKNILNFSFSIVWTKENNDFEETVKWFQDKFDDINVPVSAEGVVEAYDINTALNDRTGKFTEEYAQKFENSVYKGITEGTQPLLKVFSVVDKINEFYGTLLYKKDADHVGQKCGMDRDNDIAVDLKGNVMTCQNVGLENDHHAGHLDNIDDVVVKSSQHWSWRVECSHCPVLQLCQGSCMFLKGQEFAQTCWNEYAYNMGIFKGAIKLLTGKKVLEIEGDIRRPSL